LQQAQASFLGSAEMTWLESLLNPARARQLDSWRHPFYWAGFQLSSVGGTPH
jgi:hypothetical protein